ncbi:triple tyrosine motif-containing protein, partial [uncultured Clostridium sp.]
MSDINIVFDKDSPSAINEEINIKAISEEEENLEYKFLVGVPNERSFTWKQIRDYSKEPECRWKPESPGNYMIMVQTIDRNSGNTNTLRMKYKINDLNVKEIIEDEETKNKLIQDVIIDKTSLI